MAVVGREHKRAAASKVLQRNIWRHNDIPGVVGMPLASPTWNFSFSPFLSLTVRPVPLHGLATFPRRWVGVFAVGGDCIQTHDWCEVSTPLFTLRGQPILNTRRRPSLHLPNINQQLWPVKEEREFQFQCSGRPLPVPFVGGLEFSKLASNFAVELNAIGAVHPRSKRAGCRGSIGCRTTLPWPPLRGRQNI